MIIVGWGHQRVKVLGPTPRARCPRCEKEDYPELVKVSTYATLFFVPVLPYRTEYLLRCPICTLSHKVEGEQLQQLQDQSENLLSQLRG